MNAIPEHPLVKALAVLEGKYFSMSPRREKADNALMFLGLAEKDQAASAELADWHDSALELLTEPAGSDAHRILPGTTSTPGARLLGTPWYAVFEYKAGNASVPGDLWVGRFFREIEGQTETSNTGVFVFPDALLPADPNGGNPILNSRKADRSVILRGETAAGDNTLGSNHGGEGGRLDTRPEW